MATFAAQHQSEHALPVAPAAALAHWSDPDAQLRARPEVVASERPAPGQLRLRLKEMKHGPTAFAGDYTLQFATEGTLLRWTTVSSGPLQVEGEARFAQTASGCSVVVRETARVTLPVPGLLAVALRPLVETMMARGSKGFAERMAADIAARARRPVGT